MSCVDRRVLLKPYASSEHPHFKWAVSGPSEDGTRRWRRLFVSRTEAEEFFRETQDGLGMEISSQPRQPEDSPPSERVSVEGPPLTFAEKIFLGPVTAAIFASSWLLGGRFPWAQWTMLGLCGLSFLFGALVFLLRSRSPERPFTAWTGWWVTGLATVGFVAFVGIQSVNISHTHQIGDNDCILTSVPHQQWLPTSISGPFAGFAYDFIPMQNASRYLLIYGAAILGGLALMLGVQSRRCLQVVLKVLLAHGILSALICVAHQWSGSLKVLWIQGDALAFLGAPFFFNKNQNAAYQTLLAGVMLFFAGRWMVSGAGRMRLSGALLFAVAELGLASIRSRAGLLFAGVLGAVWLMQQRAMILGWWRSSRLGLVTILFVLLAFGSVAFWKTGGLGTAQRFGDERVSANVILHGGKYRQLLHEIAWEMFADRPWYGWGAAGYFYTYAQYEKKVPEMAFNRPGYSYYLLTGSADGDWYEFLAEFGIVGTTLFAVIWLPHLFLWARLRIWSNPPVFMPALAVMLILIHGLIDQSFRNVGLLFLHLAMAVMVTKLMLEQEAAAPAHQQQTAQGDESKLT